MKKILMVLLIALFAVSITAMAQEKVEEKQKDMKQESKECVCKNVCLPCGAEIKDKSKALEYEYEGKTYYFCSEQCLEAFKADPEKYIKECCSKEKDLEKMKAEKGCCKEKDMEKIEVKKEGCKEKDMEKKEWHKKKEIEKEEKSVKEEESEEE